MRFSLVLERTGKKNFLPFNYQYELSSWIYKVISMADTDFSNFLHGSAFQSGTKSFKLFTFSNLDLRPFRIHKQHGRIEIIGKHAVLQISFMVDKAAENFIKGLFLNQQFSIGDKISNVDFCVSRIESESAPIFTERMVYRTLSPMCVSIHGERHAQYISPSDREYESLLFANLIGKLKSMPLLHGNKSLQAVPEEESGFSLLSEPKSRLISIKSFTRDETRVRGYEFKFELRASPLLQEIGYYSGFGEKNSTGFGCVEIV